MPIPTDASLEWMRGLHVDPTHVLKCALYTTILTAATGAYTATNEVAAGGGYTTGGFTLAVGAFTPNFWGLSNNVSVFDAADTASPPASTFTFRSLLIYNDTHASKKALYYYAAGANVVVSNNQLIIQWPTPDNTSGLIRCSG